MTTHPGDRAPGGRPGAGTQRGRSGRLAVVTLASAASLAGASAISWWRRDYVDSLTGSVHVTLAGSAVIGELVTVAVVAVAGLGALLATRGWLRRLVGGLLIAMGAVEAVRVVSAWSDVPAAALQAELARPAVPDGPAQLNAVGPALATAGACLLVLAGLIGVLSRVRSARVGSAYQTPGARKAQLRKAVPGTGTSGTTATTTASGSITDDGDWWRAIDAGIDPTDRDGDGHAVRRNAPTDEPGAEDGP